jgi:serine/threonine protein phosphatase 1
VETENEICVHACLEPGIPLEEQSGVVLRWERFTGEYPPWPTGQRIICGHTAQHSGVPIVSDGWVCIDTCAYGGQFLSCLDTNSDLLYQARQTGEVRGPVPLAEVAIPV